MNSKVSSGLRWLYYFLLKSKDGWKVVGIDKEGTEYKIRIVNGDGMTARLYLWENK
jgi:hypothetical protein